jgi:hypothetical protein
MRGGDAVASLRPKWADGSNTNDAVCDRRPRPPVMMTIGGESEVAADWCDRTGAPLGA